MEEQRHKNCSKASTSRQQPRNQAWKKFATLSGLVVVIAVVAGVFIYSFGEKSEQPQTGRAPLVGNWSRPDGDYTICIRGVDSDGKMQAGYFNPNPIHVAQATVSSQNNVIKLFIELRDAGYPGSKYDLVYKPGEDILQGTYYQAQDQELYNVVFLRKHDELK
jgi:hypothetical protein